MKNWSIVAVVIFVGGILLFSASSLSQMQKKDAPMIHATGTFEVKIVPQTDGASENSTPSLVSRMTIDKQFHGDLEGISKGQMLAAGTAVKGSAGYVAVELVTGTLGGRSGTFILQHTGTMTRGTPTLSVTVVPDSGTGQLAGLAGRMNIIIGDGKHSYEFDYLLSADGLEASADQLAVN